MVLLDLSAAFDTADHSLLLARLSTCFGICDQALDWFRSYLSDRTQYVRIQDVSSDVHALPYGVPQGSVLGLLLYYLYTSPLGDIARSHGVSYHFYADDTQLYLSYETSSPEDLSTSTSAFEDCVKDIDLSILKNKLKLNSGKTEIIVFSSSYRTHPVLKNLVIASDTVDCSTTVKNIGVIFNNSLSMLPHVTAVCKSSFFHLRNIVKIRKFLSHDACKTLIHAFITARIDYCNSLLYGQPKCILKHLQSVLNSAARLIHLTRYEHVTPLLIQLHWLPIEERITFKIAVITFKALHGAAPSYITDLIKPYTPGRLLRSSDQLLLSTSKVNLKTYGGRSFTIAAPSVWNALPF